MKATTRRSPGRNPVRWARRLAVCREQIRDVQPLAVEGMLSRMVGMTLEAVGCEAAVGGRAAWWRRGRA